MSQRISVRQARPGDLRIVERLMQHVIVMGCVSDHHNQADTLAAWCQTKQREQIACWLDDPAIYLNIVRWQGRPAGTAFALGSGEICQCFVLPRYWQLGLGRALIDDLEQAIGRWGRTHVSLYSTATAQVFFERLGYRADGAAVVFHGLHLQPMHKALPPLRLGPKSVAR